MRRVFAALSLLLLALPAAAGPAGAARAQSGENGENGIAIREWGIYSVDVTGYTKAPEDIAGERFNAANVKLVRRTKEILAQPRLTFGFAYEITDPSLIGRRLTLELVFPKMTNPETGRSATRLSEHFTALPGMRREMFRFDFRWEMAEGIWTYRLRDGDRVLAAIRFKVIVALN